ncbi:pre-mRNA 3'-end-processing factor FIP1-like [Lineus longissimus]|uniref:pre-mRNA 3'-end-processing factor FIP1-like n=1 Tax=Lineus longissimus TaxID=88925 RepID=UPI002B4F1AC3
MATEIEDDEAWLYGDSKKDEEDEVEPAVPGTADSRLSADAPEFEPKEKSPDDTEGGEQSGDEHAPEAEEGMEEEAPEGEEQEEEEDEDSDDDVQITIGDIKSGPVDAPARFKAGAAYQRTASVVAAAAKKPSDGKGVDVDTPGAINGVQIYEFDLETIQEKPWLKPGADLTDYFNYGFNEETWKKYCEKQKSVRLEYNPGSLQKPLIYNTHSATGQPHHSYESRTVTTVQTDENKNPNNSVVTVTVPRKEEQQQWRAAPPPRRKFSGTIDVIGSTERDSRRPQNYSNIPVAGSGGNDYNSQSYGAPASTIPSHSAPPPQPNFSAPPPMMHQAPMPNYNVPPPNMPPPQQQYGGQGPPAGYYGPPPGQGGPPPQGPPPGGYDYGGYGGPPPSQQPNYGPPQQYGGGPPPQAPYRSPDRSSPQRHWDYSGHPGGRSPDDYKSSSRDHYRERSRSRERDRPERRFKEHKEHKKRKYEEEENGHKTKHKKSRRSKKDREGSAEPAKT